MSGLAAHNGETTTTDPLETLCHCDLLMLKNSALLSCIVVAVCRYFVLAPQHATQTPQYKKVGRGSDVLPFPDVVVTCGLTGVSGIQLLLQCTIPCAEEVQLP